MSATVYDQVEEIREEMAASPFVERLLRYVATDAAWKAHAAAAVSNWEDVELWSKLVTDCAGALQLMAEK